MLDPGSNTANSPLISFAVSVASSSNLSHESCVEETQDRKPNRSVFQTHTSDPRACRSEVLRNSASVKPSVTFSDMARHGNRRPAHLHPQSKGLGLGKLLGLQINLTSQLHRLLPYNQIAKMPSSGHSHFDHSSSTATANLLTRYVRAAHANLLLQLETADSLSKLPQKPHIPRIKLTQSR